MALFQKENPYEFTDLQFEKICRDIVQPRDNVICDETVEFSFWKQKLPSRQECFCHFLEPFFKQANAHSVLEVGGGRTYRLSRMLADKSYQVTCIDPALEPGECPENLTLLRQHFDYLIIDLTPYDIVIGQEPCGATEHLVRACVEQSKPFVLVLCGAPHPYLSGQTPENVYEWYDYLSELAGEHAAFHYMDVYNGFKAAVLYQI